MPQYGVFVIAPAPADPMAISEAYAEGLERHGAQVEELGGKAVGGYAFQPSTTAVTVRDGKTIEAPFTDGTHVLSGYYVLETPDQDTAVRIAALNPVSVDGGFVEVRPLFEPPAE